MVGRQILARLEARRRWAGPIACMFIVASAVALAAGAGIANAAVPGDTLWTHYQPAGSGSEDYAAAVVGDAAGNGYFAGSFSTPSHGADVRVTKVASNGRRLWSLAWGGASHKDDFPAFATLDRKAGLLYVIAVTTDASDRQRLALLCITAGGRMKWVRTWAARGGLEVAWPSGIGLDAAGNAYIATFTQTAGHGARQSVVLKYSRAGRLQWARLWSPAGLYFVGRGMAVRSDGTVAAVGSTTDGSTSYDAVTLEYSAAGTLRWHSIYAGAAGGADKGQAVAFGPGGSAYVAGSTIVDSAGTNDDVLFLKYGGSGTLLWSRSRDAGKDLNDSADLIAVDGSGNVYGAGYGITFASTQGLVVFSYHADGSAGMSWTTDAGLGSSCEAQALLWSAGRLYVSGQLHAPGPARSTIVVASLDPTRPWGAVRVWSTPQLDGGGTWGYCSTAALALSGASGLFVAGSAQRPWGAASMGWDGFMMRIRR